MYSKGNSSKRGVVLMNLGSPNSASVKDVKKYLSEFLMDERVIDLPYIARLLLVRGIIVPFRSPKSAEAYETIWTKEGSPLVNTTFKQQVHLEERSSYPIVVSMRYGSPNPRDAYESLLSKVPDLEEVVLLPLYPHYAMSSYETAVKHMEETHRKLGYGFKLIVVPPFYNNRLYIDAYAAHIKPYLEKQFDHLLFSFHGIPERHLLKTDTTQSHCLKIGNCCETPSIAHETCYKHQCLVTMNLTAKALGLKKEQYSHAFQSRLGRDPWLKPYTDFRLKDMPKEGIRKLMVVCPAFVSDCLETLEEIAIRGKEDFLEAGGESYEMIPCLNEDLNWIAAMSSWIDQAFESSSNA